MRAVRFGFALGLIFSTTFSHLAGAQWRVGHDSATRLTRFGRAIAYGTVLGLGYAGVDQVNDQPGAWAQDWRGYGKRAASNVGEFLIQESVTDAAAAIMGRPLDYTRCRCGSTVRRIGWAVKGAVTDQTPGGRHPIAIPRILGAYSGAYAQTTWKPSSASRATATLINGTSSLAIGALINLFYEFK